MQQARNLRAQDRLADAQRLLAEVPLAADSVDALFLRAEIAARLGQLGECRQALRACLQKAPGHAGALFQLAVLDLSDGAVAQARDGFAAATRAAPGFASAHYNLGVLQAETGELAAAEASYRAALGAQPDLVQAANNLANLLIGRGAWAQALPLLQTALSQAPQFATGWSSLGLALLAADRIEPARNALERSLALDPHQPAALENLGEALLRLQQPALAREAFEAALALAPASSALAFKLAALRGDTPPRPPDEFVRGLFDRMAEDFDRRLVEGLAYTLPLQLEPYLPQAQNLDILDLGCGTGLAGAALRPRARQLEGVDLAPKMLDKARARGLYDALHEAPLPEFLDAGEPGRWDLLLAADLFIYMGALGPVLRACHRALRPGGWLLCSLELPPSTEAAFALQPSARYAHAPAHVEELARACGFEVGLSQALDLRREHGHMLQGWLLRLRVPAAVIA